MSNTYAIHPGRRLLERLESVLTSSIMSIDAFAGVALRNDISFTDTQLPFISIEISSSEEKPLNSGIWHVGLSVVLAEDREEAQIAIASATGDARARHEARLENLTARLSATWDGSNLVTAINAVSNTQSLIANKTYGHAVTHDASDEGKVYTQFTLTVICASSSQA